MNGRLRWLASIKGDESVVVELMEIHGQAGFSLAVRFVPRRASAKRFTKSSTIEIKALRSHWEHGCPENSDITFDMFADVQMACMFQNYRSHCRTSYLLTPLLHSFLHAWTAR